MSTTTGRWIPLPPLEGAGRIRHVDVALGRAGPFLGITPEGDAPRVLHGRWLGGELDWSGTSLVPLPSPRPRVKNWMTSWAAVGDSLAGLHLTIDRLDPMRIAVNRLEYQGGSYGLVVGGWGHPFLEIAYPDHETDIRFGMPMILRGQELFTHDAAAFWHFRLTDTGVSNQRLNLSDEVDELGWHATVDEDAQTVVLSAFTELIALKRDRAGVFELDRRVKMPSIIEDVAMGPDGQTIVVSDAGDAFEIRTFDRDWRETRRSTRTDADLEGAAHSRGEGALGAATNPRSATIAGARVLLTTARTHAVLDIPSDRHVRLSVPPAEGHALRAAMHANDVLLVNRERIGIYSIGRAF